LRQVDLILPEALKHNILHNLAKREDLMFVNLTLTIPQELRLPEPLPCEVEELMLPEASPDATL
jgi:hypothetical protein